MWKDFWTVFKNYSPSPIRFIWLRDYFKFCWWLLDSFKMKTVLEAGCGSGATSIPFVAGGARAILLDLNSDALQISRSVYRSLDLEAEVVLGTIFSMPFREDVFDLTHNDGVLEHFKPEDCIKILGEMKRVGKLVIVSVPYWWNIGGLLSKLYCKAFRKKWPFGGEMERGYREQDLTVEFSEAEINVKFIKKIGRTGGVGTVLVLLLTSLPLSLSLIPFAQNYVNIHYSKNKPHDLKSFQKSMQNEPRYIFAIVSAIAKITNSWDNLIVGGIRKVSNTSESRGATL
jgi:ubiquinone/menaquinone biosynthesis C-methylase UbiE